MDDILVYGKTIEEHSERLHKAFKRLTETTLNGDKCVFAVDARVKFLGHILDHKGIHIDDKKIKAITTEAITTEYFKT